MNKVKKFFMWFRIPVGIYCHDGNGCPYWEHVKVTKLTKKNCDFAKTCEHDCKKERCRHRVTRCEYMDFTDEKEDTLLWDQCKECGAKYGFNIKDWIENKLYEWKILK